MNLMISKNVPHAVQCEIFGMIIAWNIVYHIIDNKQIFVYFDKWTWFIQTINQTDNEQ